MKVNFHLAVIICTSLLLSACGKDPDTAADAITCTNIQSLQIVDTITANIGSPLQINIPEVGGYRLYKLTGPDNFSSQNPTNSVASNAELKHEGIYYVSISNPTCGIKTDSIYVDVKLLQGNPSCSVGVNKVTYSNLFDDAFTSVTKTIDPLLSQLVIDASIFGSMKVHFHPYWRQKEPEDGIYTTINTPVFPQFDYNYNKVFITTTKSSINWSSQANQTVYINHVNGKLQVRFCGLLMSGYNGTSFTTSASGNLVVN